MTEFFVRKFIKDYENVEKVSVRTAYGVMAGIVGIFCNVLLFLAKGAAGLALGSISVIADAFNNLSDAGSSIVSLVGVKLAQKPADEEHPFGHGRIEYIAALIVAFFVIQVGFTFFKEAVGKILHPQAMTFGFVSLVVLLFSIGVKLWLRSFNLKLGKRIDSKVMSAVAADAMGDVLTTSATIVSILFFRFTGINIDGIVGLGVSLIVIWAGIGIAKDTLEPLIGEAVPSEVYRKISDFVERYDGIEGTHDLIVHNYGPGRSMASIHAEVPNDVDIETSHEVIDKIETDAKEELGIFLVIHMDPVETKDEKVLSVKAHIEEILCTVDPFISIHDFRMVEGKERINLIFDLLVPHEYNKEKQGHIVQKLEEKIHSYDTRFECVITVESGFIAKTEKAEE